jgi:hypothetical protein
MFHTAKYSSLLLWICLSSFAFQSSGQIIAIDNFDNYTTGNFSNGSSAGTGWTNNWTVTGSNTAVVNLNTLLPGQGYTVGDQTISFTGNNNSPVRRNFAPQTDTMYVSYDFTLLNGSVDNNDFASLWLQSFQFPSGPNIGFKGNSASNNPNNFDLFARARGGAEVYGSPNLSIGQTYTLVGQLYKSVPSGNYDRFALWVNPGSGDANSPQQTSTADSGFSTISSLGWRLVNLDNDDQVLINNLTLGGSWDDVVPAEVIPEPSTYAVILGIMAIGIAVWRRKMRENN